MKKEIIGEAEKQLRDLFDKFVALHPNTIEAYDPTIESASRWKWAIQHAYIRNEKEQQPFDMPDNRAAKLLAESRAVGTFDRLPTISKNKFLALASLFPGRDVYATGSRLTGEYIDKDSPGKIKEMRAALMKPEKEESDYDITLIFTEYDNLESIRSMIPEWGDIIQNVPDDEPKILIPMWDFSKLPISLHNDILEMVKNSQWGKLMSIHNDYNLSPTQFCCDSMPAQRWFLWAIENGIIKKQENDTGER